MKTGEPISSRGNTSITSGAHLRRAFLDYFASRAQAPAAGEMKPFPHTVVPAAPLIPPDDPTLLFTSAGMVQFKRLYSGEVDPLPYRRAATCQKCLRAGGKGSDLENVGKTLRHFTLFEMLGNFSFGDYFKREAIRFAWEFCVSPRYMGLPAERMFATVYGPTAQKPEIPPDTEAAAAWQEESADLAARGLVPRGLVNPVITLDEKENFWGPAGETGACGPCSEIKFFMGTDEELAEAQALAARDPHALGVRIVEEGDLFLEIWNMVFPQYDQQRDGSRPMLKNRGIDTGAGLERMALAHAWWHGGGEARSPYETDLLWPIVQAVSEVTGLRYSRIATGASAPEENRRRLAINAITDHARALVFCIAEGITPSNDGRGYVVRRIQRRALRLARLQGINEPFLYRLVEAVAHCPSWMDPVTGEHVYPEITRNLDRMARTIRLEEERFLRTLDQGTRLLDDLLGKAKAAGAGQIQGEDVFRLHATYGFPPDLTREIVEDAGLAYDEAGYRQAMRRHQEEARDSWKGAALGEEAALLEGVAEQYGPTQFSGYTYDSEPEAENAGKFNRGAGTAQTRLLAIVAKDAAGAPALLDEVEGGADHEEVILVFAETPFYAESGGQVGDTGWVWSEPASAAGALEIPDAAGEILDTQKTPNGLFLHRTRLRAGARLREGGTVAIRPDWKRRWAIMRNHTSTHLLQAALRGVIGDQIRQSGSWVGPETLRFDFTHMEQVPREALAEIERRVNEWIADDRPVKTEVLPLEEARRRGAIAPFGEKYGPTVRLVGVEGVSLEFCGGTHLRRSGQALRFRILGESSIAAGVRRIEAAAGLAAYLHEVEDRRTLDALAQRLQARGDEAVERLEALHARARELEKEVARLKQAQGAAGLQALVSAARELEGGAKLVIGELPGLSAADLRPLADQARQMAGGRALVLLATAAEDKAALICLADDETARRYPANKVINVVAEKIGGKGGGKPAMAQAGGKNPAALAQALRDAPALILAMGK